MDIKITRNSSTPLYIQIYHQIQEEILAGRLPSGYRLPPERKLAATLNVNRSTVLNAYRELKASGLVDSQVGKGTIVAQPATFGDENNQNMVNPISWGQIYNQNAHKNNDSIVLDLIEITNKADIISFAAGMASPELYPMDDLTKITVKVMQDYGYKALMHTPIEGHVGLRNSIKALQESMGITSKIEEIMILSGSQQGLDLIARVLLETGDTILVEEPTYLGALQLFRNMDVRVIGVPIDQNGMRMDILESHIIRYKPKLIYTMPTFQNPTGAVMSLERRKKLLDLAYYFEIPIIEDDAYGFLRYDGETLPTLRAMDSYGYVLYLNTFSKILFPGLRVGWFTIPRAVVKQFALAKQNIDIHTNSLSQWILNEYITEKLLPSHLEKVKKAYLKRRDCMLNALQKYHPSGVTWNVPEGGLYIWCKLPENIDASKILLSAGKHNVAFVPGETFYSARQGKNYIRLNFTCPSIKAIEKGIKCLMTIINDEINSDNENTTYMDTTPIY